MEKINILIVDDTLDTIVSLNTLLKKEGIDITDTAGFEEARKLSSEQEIDIVIINVDMAVVDGFELADQLKLDHDKIRIIFMTAISKKTKAAVEKLPIETLDYLYKPLDLPATAAKVNAHIQLLRYQREQKSLNHMDSEILEPINGILKITELLKNTSLSAEQWDMVNLLELASTSLLGVVNDVLANKAQPKPAVSDSGIGIATEDIDKILQTLELADEKISIKSRSLSVAENYPKWNEVPGETKVNEKPMEELLIPLNHIKILVAEDNPVNRFLITKILQKWQVDVDVVENGKEALEKLKERDYHLILMDTYMPIMNGLEAIKLIREGHIAGKENIPIISFSAAVMETDIETAKAAGANDIISKPFEPAALHKKILEYAIG